MFLTLSRLALVPLLVSLVAVPVAVSAQARPAGRVPIASDLQGTWVYDLEASQALLKESGLPDEVLTKMRPELQKNVGSTYIFKGNAFEVRGARNNGKGTWRLESGDLVATSNRGEERLQAALPAPGRLVLAAWGVGMVYKKQ